MPVLPLDCHLPTQYTTHTITLQQWTNNKTNKSYKQLIYIYIYISHVNVTQTVPDISPLMPMHQYPLLVYPMICQKPLIDCKAKASALTHAEFDNLFNFVLSTRVSAKVGQTKFGEKRLEACRRWANADSNTGWYKRHHISLTEQIKITRCRTDR